MTGGIYPGEGPRRQHTPITRSEAMAILAICAGVLALAVLGAVI